MRPIVALEVDGLVLTGRAIPRAVVSGTGSFDAVEQYLTYKDDEPHAQTTASLLLSLRTAVSRSIGADTRTSRFTALQLWGELARRGVEIERVALGGLVREMAIMVASRATLAALIKADLMHPGLAKSSSDDDASASAWVEILEAAYSDSLEQSDLNRRHESVSATRSILARAYPALEESGELDTFLADHPEVSFAFSTRFTGRVAQWFSHLVEENLEAALVGQAPSSVLFTALPPRAGRDEVGFWIWERFTVTAVEDWSLSSMMLEWKWAKEAQTDACARRAMAERVIPQDVIGELALGRASATHVRPRRRTGLDASNFIEQASERLANGDWLRASRIFGGLVELRPGDADAWNNLGFCLIWGDTEVALESLRRAELLYRMPTYVCRANQILALHILGRDGEALALVESTFAGPARSGGMAVMWGHPGDNEGEPTLLDDVDPTEYLQELYEHISGRACVQPVSITI
ncbi:hypothetical protein C3B59_18230 [Cryobacterium zongtaii]|uniref:Tetratricopeptide repeat-containing protein n=1 Tax=Cryobacterium zongtaii TaxID=1259217 RepID=A0A2S3Z5E3_9MICO|nr:hypothetical protein [Cryobacterium zongtaii]POH59152.1 hypothetical protein C3B59_18230 [Cryobacterium zongtaii]